MIRNKKTLSGKLLESDFYPVFEDGRRVPERAPKQKRSTEQQEKYNQKQAEKKFIRLVNANFDEGDVIQHLTYCPENAPASLEEARKHIVNYLRRMKRHRASDLKKVTEALEALPDSEALREQRAELEARKKKLEQPFKYIYVIEKVTYKRGKYAGRDNWHFHLFMTGGIPRRKLEEIWPHGLRVNADSFQPKRFGPEAAARYMSKDPQGSKRFCCSRNLDKPKTSKPQDGKITPRGLARLAQQRVDDREYWERKYKGYSFLRCYARYNEYNGYWYVSVVMYKKDGGEPPHWGYDDWMDG